MQKVFLFLCIGILGVVVCRKAAKTKPVLRDVLLANVVALAENESGFEGLTDCIGSGNYTCPIRGEKVGFVYQGYSLQPDEEID